MRTTNVLRPTNQWSQLSRGTHRSPFCSLNMVNHGIAAVVVTRNSAVVCMVSERNGSVDRLRSRKATGRRETCCGVCGVGMRLAADELTRRLTVCVTE
jgi:hypothetical protein